MRNAHAVRPSSLARSIRFRPAWALLVALLTSVALFEGCGGSPGNTTELFPSTTLLRWHGIATDAMAADHAGAQEQAGPCRSARAMAIVHIAVFETLITLNG